jgi:hypothetical protein
MRILMSCAALAAGCGATEAVPDAPGAIDGAAADAALADAAAPDAACERVLLVGGTDVAAQGWTVSAQGPHTLDYGADYVELQTTTTTGATTSGSQLLSYPDAFVAGDPIALEVVLRLDAVDPHNSFDAGAAILAAFTPPFGLAAEREQMVYLDAAAVGWADDSQSAAVTVLDGAYHTYVLTVDAAQNAALSVDGTAVLARTAFVTNGTIAVGDQTNDPDVDSALRIRSVRLLCP